MSQEAKNTSKTNLATEPPSADIDVINQYTGEKWYYSDIVKEHFFHPRNLLMEKPKNEDEFDARGMVGSPACGDMMEMWMKIEKTAPSGEAGAPKADIFQDFSQRDGSDLPAGRQGLSNSRAREYAGLEKSTAEARQVERIKELKWKTFGCASAIAATSMYSVMLTENGGMTLGDALKVRPQDVMKRLGGLPNRKIHCSVLADKAFQKTANDYFRKTGQYDRIVVEGARVVDARLNITDKDIEEAVLEGATNLEEVQKKLKVGVGASDEVKTDVESLIRFYTEKYYG